MVGLSKQSIRRTVLLNQAFKPPCKEKYILIVTPLLDYALDFLHLSSIAGEHPICVLCSFAR